MRIEVNLATQPYEDLRRFYMRWLPLLIVLAVIAAVLTAHAYGRYQETRSIDTKIAQERAEIDKLDARRAEAQTTLRLPENAGTADQAQFLNAVFARKSFSWTQVLSDLEKITPPGVQVMSMRPELTPDHQIQFRMTVATSKRENAIELLRRMENSPSFADAQVRSETIDTKTVAGAPPIRFEISTMYVVRPQVTQARSTH